MTSTENTTAASGVRLLGAITGVVALLSMAIVIALMRYDTLSMRVSIVQLRAHDLGRPVVVGWLSGALTVASVWHHQRLRLISVLLLSGCVVIGLTALVRRAAPMFPISDQAVTELGVIQASHGTLLVGPYSRFGWRHPGPLYAYLVTPVYALAGHRTAAVNAGALTINLAALAIMVLVVGRLAHPALMLSILALCLIYLVRTSGLMTSEWNPHVTVLPLFALVSVCAAVGSGHVGWLPVAAFIASFESQTHVAFAPVSVALIGLASSASWIVTPSSDRAMWRRWLNASLWVLALVWMLPIAEQLTHTPGNMTRLWGFFVTAHQSRPPLSTAVGAWIDMFSGLARSDLTIPIGLPRARSMLAWSSLLALTTCLLLPVAAVSAWRARRRFECWFATMTGLACLVSAWSATRIAESIVDHEVFWVSAIGVMALASTLAWVADRINLYGSSGAWHWLKPMVCGMFALTAVLIGTREIRQIVEHSNYPNPDEIAVLRLSDAVLAESRQQGIHKPLVRIEQRWWPLAAGVLLQLDKAAMPLSVERRWVPVFGEALAPRGDEDWEVTIGGTVVHDRLCARAGNVTLAERGNVYVDAVPLVRVPDSK